MRFSPTHRFFSQMTHLEIFYTAEHSSTWLARLPLLPQLSHFSFADVDLLPICPDLLQACKLLAVLAYLADTDIDGYTSPPLPPLFQDIRFVLVTPVYSGPDWIRGIETGMDYWKRAEMFIAQRRSGEIEASQYRIDIPAPP
ncbi:hypothetical protein B0H15DRAFT_944223 [Mycena belliarum]|uniref:Uncharacterized protein n=1 Tax=Mycena belliarum TaxID=1033014 RepID=A0AAD6UHY2_9AGAR|nr:hypothetical protein B0H15DRAFT_944223 [Mycena belliae]